MSETVVGCFFFIVVLFSLCKKRSKTKGTCAGQKGEKYTLA